MNIHFILSFILLMMSLSDFIKPDKNKTVHNLIYYITFFFVYFFASIKYYYGPDIALYIPIYEEIGNPITTILRSLTYKSYYENGFLLFCSLIKFLGFSYWSMTFIYTSIYFYAIFKLFRKLENYKTFALLLLVLFESGLFIHQLRQSLAVAFFILAYLAYLDKKYIWTFFHVFLCISMHKSGIFICFLSGIFIFFNKRVLKEKIFLYLSVLLLILIVISLKPFLLYAINLLPINHLAKLSISHHLLLTDNLQLIAPFYLLLFYSLYYYSIKKPFDKPWNDIILLLSFLIVFLYQDFYLLNRIRSYFLPIAIVYFINILSVSVAYKKPIYKQLLIGYVYLMCFIVSYSMIKNSIRGNDLYEYSTIFQRFSKSEKQIKKENEDKAERFWKEEYMKNKEFKSFMNK